MDSYENEASKFAAQRTKLKNICEAHDLTYTFIKNSYPIKLIIRPIKGVGEQMSMLETASEDSYISPDAYLLFTMKDGVLVYRMSKTFTISDTLFNKIKNIFKNMHYLWLQFFFRDLVEGGKLAALGYKMPDIPESGGQQDAPRGNEPDSPNLPGEAEPLEEIEDDEEDELTSDELTQATEIARQNNGITQAMLEEKMGVTAEKAIALLDDMESAGVIEFSNGHYLLADTEEE
nr:MAG: Ftsk gamma domain protein [Bacteriophage sp.]